MLRSAAHFSNLEIRETLLAKVSANCASEAEILVLIAEADSRKMYLDEGYPSMYAWCIEYFHFSKDVAFKRIHAARAAREYPVLFGAVEDGRLHLSAVRLIASHLTPENVDELVAGATHRTCEEIEEMVARRVVRLETMLEGSDQMAAPTKLASTAERSTSSAEMALMIPQQAARPVMSASQPVAQPVVAQLALAQETSAEDPVAEDAVAKETPVCLVDAISVPDVPSRGPEPRVSVALEKRVHGKLQYARALLSHCFALSSDSQVIERALDDLIAKAERTKFGATKHPRPPRPSELRSRAIPTHVRRAVWGRDGGQCTFVSDKGRRCTARRLLEFDHVEPVARGGKATVAGIRLRCRGHNQYAAEQAFGAGFMETRRKEAMAARAGRTRSAAVQESGGEAASDAETGLGVEPRDRAAAGRARREQKAYVRASKPSGGDS
jgi:hypothetical protein